MRKLSSVLALAAVAVLCGLALSAQANSSKLAVKPGTLTPLPGTRVEQVPGSVDSDGDGVPDADGDAVAPVWVLICPPGCPKVVTPPNHHGEVDEFCDCNGDGRQDEACKIWLKTNADGSQRTICHPGCPGEGQAGGQQCSKHTVEKPDGTVYQYCACV